MTLTGADTDALRELATDLAAGASELQQLSAELARAIDAAHAWQGPDATRCKDRLGDLARTRITGVADALETAGALLRREAADQDTASGDTPAQQRPGLLAQLWTWGRLAQDAFGTVGDITGLASFFRRLGPATSFLARTRAAITAAEGVLGMGSDLGVRAAGTALGRLLGTDLAGTIAAVAPFGKAAAKILPVVSLVQSIPDIVDRGGYAGWRGEITRGLALANTVAAIGLTAGAMSLGTAAMAASAPFLVGGAVLAMGAYGAWSLGNDLDSALDASPRLSGYRTAIVGALTRSEAWRGARSILEVSSTFARGVLGPAPAPAGAPR